MGRMTLGDFARRGRTGGQPVDSRGGLRFLHKAGGGLSGGLGDSRKIFAFAMMQQQQAAAAAAANAKALKAIEGKFATMESDIVSIARVANAARDQSFSVQDMANQVDHPSAFSMSQDAQDAASDIDAIADEARQAFRAFEDEFSAARSSGNYTALLPSAAAASNTIKNLGGRIKRAGNALAMTVGRLTKLQGDAAERRRLSALEEDERRRIIEERLQRDLADQAAADDRLAQADADRRAQSQAARDMELELQREQLAEQRRIAEEQRAFEAEDRARSAQVEQARIDAELRREQMAIDAEERRRFQMQEAALREEERAIRREEREAQLAQLMMIQELAASGLPSQFLPPGLAPPQPQTPAGMAPAGPGGQYVMPGFAPQPGAVPQQTWTPWGPMVAGPGGAAPMGFGPQVPGVALQPGFAPQGYAATAPQPYQQSPGFAPGALAPSPYPQQPQGEAPPGFAWGGFDPGTEMFGMGGLGDLVQPLNASMQGGMIEEGWRIVGPDSNGSYTIYRGHNRQPTGQVFGVFSEDQIYQGSIRDPSTNQIVFVSPQRPQGGGTAAAVTSDIASVLREAIKAVGSVESEKERRKAAKYGAFQTASIPGGGAGFDPYAAGPPARVPAGVWIAGGLAAAGAAFWALTRKKKKSKKGE